MVDFTSLLAFSHTHCIAICSVLVPLNLLTTIQTLLLIGWGRSGVQVSSGLGGLCAFAMVLHVLTWFVIGVVMVPTYVLLWLGGTCGAMNLWAIAHPQSLRVLLMTVARWLRQRVQAALS